MPNYSVVKRQRKARVGLASGAPGAKVTKPPKLPATTGDDGGDDASAKKNAVPAASPKSHSTPPPQSAPESPPDASVKLTKQQRRNLKKRQARQTARAATTTAEAVESLEVAAPVPKSKRDDDAVEAEMDSSTAQLPGDAHLADERGLEAPKSISGAVESVDGTARDDREVKAADLPEARDVATGENSATANIGAAESAKDAVNEGEPLPESTPKVGESPKPTEPHASVEQTEAVANTALTKDSEAAVVPALVQPAGATPNVAGAEMTESSEADATHELVADEESASAKPKPGGESPIADAKPAASSAFDAQSDIATDSSVEDPDKSETTAARDASGSGTLPESDAADLSTAQEVTETSTAASGVSGPAPEENKASAKKKPRCVFSLGFIARMIARWFTCRR